MPTVIVLVVLGILMFVSSAVFWLAVKRDLFRQRLLSNRELLMQIMVLANEKLSFENRAAKFTRVVGKYNDWVNLFEKSDSKANSLLKEVGLIVSIGIITVTFFLSLPGGITMLIIFFLMIAISIRDIGRASAATSILEVATVIYKWERESPREAWDWSLLTEYRELWNVLDIIRSATKKFSELGMDVNDSLRKLATAEIPFQSWMLIWQASKLTDHD